MRFNTFYFNLIFLLLAVLSVGCSSETTTEKVSDSTKMEASMAIIQWLEETSFSEAKEIRINCDNGGLPKYMKFEGEGNAFRIQLYQVEDHATSTIVMAMRDSILVYLKEMDYSFYDGTGSRREIEYFANRDSLLEAFEKRVTIENASQKQLDAKFEHALPKKLDHLANYEHFKNALNAYYQYGMDSFAKNVQCRIIER